MILSLGLGLFLGALAAVLFYRLGFSRRKQELGKEIERQELEAQMILGEAQKSSEQRKRELLLQAKEEIHKARLNLETEARDRKQELQRERNRLEQKESSLDRKLEQQEQREAELESRLEEVQKRQEALRELEDEKRQEIERISGLSMDEARQQVLETAERSYRHDKALMLKQMQDQLREEVETRAKELVVCTIQRYASDYVAESTVSVVTLPGEEMKGRIIGREGRNIRMIETITGVDLIIDDTPEAVILSCFNPLRRELAKLTLEKLLQDGRIHPARVEEMYHKAQKELEQTVRQQGERAAMEVGLVGLSQEMIRMLGRLYYRSSFGQNALKHSIEVALLSGMMAEELGLDGDLARRAGLLHDIGKAIDFELEGTHIELGAHFARKCKEHPVVINAIESHHGDKEANSLISSLVAAADAISAARPGARKENLETYVKRLTRLEEIAMSYPGVEKCFAIQAGRELRVIVSPEEMSEDEMVLRAHEMSKQIEEELDYPGQIKINMIRETRVVDYAK